MNINPLPLSLRVSRLMAFIFGLATTATYGAVLHMPADYPTLQAALDAAQSGDEIRIAAGVYQQSSRVQGKQLLITGEEGAVLQAWPGLSSNAPTGLLEAGPGSHLTVRGLTFDGARVAEANSQNSILGLFFYGGSGTVENCTFERFRGVTKLGSVWSYATFAGTPDDDQGPPNHVVIRNNQYRDNAVSIIIAGSVGNSDPNALRTTFAILDNVIEGIGATSLDFQLGISIIPGTSGLVKGNRVTEHFRSAPSQRPSSACTMTMWNFALPHHRVRFEGNSFLRNQQALVASEADHLEFIDNIVEGRGRTVAANLNHQGVVMAGRSVVLSGNRFSTLPTGVYLTGGTGAGSVDTLLSGNRFCDVATVLKKDSNVSGTVSVGQLGCEPDSPTAEPIEFSPGAAAAGETVTISGPDLHVSRQVLFHGTPA